MTRDPILDHRDQLQGRLLEAKRQLTEDEAQLETMRRKLIQSKAQVEGIQRALQIIAPQVAAAEDRDTTARAEAAEKQRQAIIDYEYTEQSAQLRATVERHRRTGETGQAAIVQHQLDNLRGYLERFYAPPAVQHHERRAPDRRPDRP